MSVWRRLGQWRTWRLLLRFALAGLALGIAVFAVFFMVAGRQQPGFQPVTTTLSADHVARMDAIPKYRRSEVSTYLTFPEWYLVFNPQEYAAFLKTRPPSGFPYFKSIRQFWGGYAQVYGIAHRYPTNFGNHLMVVTIGLSGSGEWLIKGAYENTVGRFFEWISDPHTQEDAFAAEVAREYGEFIPTLPWFEFPFGAKFRALWSQTDFFGPHFLRKCERKFFLSVEYGVKTVYAAGMRAASRAVFGVADTEVYVSAHHLPEKVFAHAGVKKIQPLGEGAAIITVPHYQGFTDTVPWLAQQGVDFDEFAGNDEILVTFLAPAAWRYDLGAGRPLFTQDLLNGGATRRVAVQAPVKSLGAMLREMDAKGLKLEHLFDY